MVPKSPIVWKLTLLFVAGLLLAIVITGWIGNRADEQQALAAARESALLTSRSIVESLRARMMVADKDGIRDTVTVLAGSSPIYTDVRLIRHETGEVTASRSGPGKTPLTPESRSCRTCHELEDPGARLDVGNHDEVVDLPGGGRVLAVTTPIFSEPSCRDAACHAHAGDRQVLGLVEADFSLRGLDHLNAARNLRTAVLALVAVVLSGGLIWLLTTRLVDRPMRALSVGMERLREEDFSFRYDVKGDDEFAAVARRFNAMAEKLESTMTELRDTRDYFEGIVENSADIIVTVSPHGYIYTFNRGAEEVLGYARGDMIGRRVDMLFADQEEREEAAGLLRDADHVSNYETHLLTRDGQVRDVMLTLSRLRDPEGNTIGSFGIAMDVTEQKRMQKELLHAERFAAIGQAVAGIQHALKNMLNALKGGAYMVKLGLKKEDLELLREGWEMVESGIDSLTSMSGSMLSYLRDYKPEFSAVDVTAMVRKIEGMFRETAEKKGATLTVDLAEDAPPVHADERLVHSAVMDILSNALDACMEKEYVDGEHPTIAIFAHPSPEGNGFVLAVKDNGCGMSPQVKANVFAPFFSTKKSWGTGLGLALTARTIRLHGGEIEVESEENRGSEFRIILPTSGPERDKEMPDGQEGAGR